MIKQLKMGFEMMRYAHGRLSCVIMGICFLVLGILLDILGADMSGTAKYLGSFFVILTAMWPLQLLFSVSVSNEVASSPWKKRLQTSVSVIVAFWSFLAMYLLVLLLAWFKYRSGVASEEIVVELLLVACVMPLMMAYMGGALKYFWGATIVFFVCYYALLIAAFFPELFVGIPIAAAVLAGFAGIFVGAALYFGIANLLYKRPISKASQTSSLRKVM